MIICGRPESPLNDPKWCITTWIDGDVHSCCSRRKHDGDCACRCGTVFVW